jgi:hypothetical protein
MALPERQSTAWKATAFIAMLKRAPECRRDRARPGADLSHPTDRIISHDDPGRITA